MQGYSWTLLTLIPNCSAAYLFIDFEIIRIDSCTSIFYIYHARINYQAH